MYSDGVLGRIRLKRESREPTMTNTIYFPIGKFQTLGVLELEVLLCEDQGYLFTRTCTKDETNRIASAGEAGPVKIRFSLSG